MNASQFLSEAECFKIVKRSLHTSEFDLLHWSVKPFSSDPVGFIGEHLTITASVFLHNPTIDQESRQHVQFFAKAVPRDSNSRKNFVEEMKAFEKEIIVFRKLFVDFATVLSEDDEPTTCKCYYTRHDIVVLEDLTTHGYRLFHHRDNLDFDHCALVLKTLARLHAASIIFEEKRSYPCRLDNLYPDIFFETFFVDTPGHPGNDVFQAGVNGIVYVAEMLSSYGKNTRYFEDVKKNVPKVCNDVLNLVKSSDSYKNVMCHGDLWLNNIFFLYDGDSPVRVRLVDFQFLRYSPPANDVMCFLHLTTTRNFRKVYLKDLQTVYHETLSKHLQDYGLNVDELLPLSQFLDSCIHYKKFGVITAALYSQGTVVKGEDMANIHKSSEDFHRYLRVDRKKELTRFFTTDPVFKFKNMEVVEELIEEYIFKSDN